MSGSGAPPRFARHVVAVEVHCRRCGYNLYGLWADGACPECGLETWETILHTVDPAASRLPRLENPRAVGDALLWLMIWVLLAAVVLAGRPLALWVDALDRSGRRHWSAWAPAELGFLVLAAALGGLLAVWRLAPPRGTGFPRDLRLLAAGLVGGAVLSAAATALELGVGLGPAVIILRLAASVPAIVGLLGLHGVLRTIGFRSRAYRTARGGRQSIQAMIAAIAGLVAGEILTLAAGAARLGSMATLGTLVGSASTLMLLIGLAYLVVNAWWIRSSLRRPPPAITEVLRPA